MLISNVLASVSSSLESLPLIVAAPADKLQRRAAAGGWSAHDNLAHLARYQDVFGLDRLHRILREENPSIRRYRAETDPDWPSWRDRTTRQVVENLESGRSELSSLLASLSQSEWQRLGTHPVFGRLPLVNWVQFFLIHEGHHLYVALVRSRE